MASWSLRLGWHSADAMWRQAGDTSADYNHYTKRAILELFPNGRLFELYGSTEAGWVTVLPFYWNSSRENLRGVVQTVRPGDALLGVFWSEAPVYDHSAVVLHTKQDLESLMARAQREHRECYVDAMWRVFVMKAPADQIRVVEDPGQFERIAVFPGLDEPGNTHVLWRMRTAPIPANANSATAQHP